MKSDKFVAGIFLVIVLVVSAFFAQAYADDMGQDMTIPLANRLLVSQIPLMLIMAAVISTLVLIYRISKG